MNILIKGMEMPKSCYDCELIDIVKDCPHYEIPTEAFCQIPWLRKRRHESCPLIEIPPHGRLIDADAFCEKVLEIVKRQKYDDFYAKSLSVGAILREMVRELRGEGFDGFDNAPTIIPAEEAKEGE